MARACGSCEEMVDAKRPSIAVLVRPGKSFEIPQLWLVGPHSLPCLLWIWYFDAQAGDVQQPVSLHTLRVVVRCQCGAVPPEKTLAGLE
jgi:hypothetical protein